MKKLACSILASAFEINGVSLPRNRSFNSTLILVFLPFNDSSLSSSGHGYKINSIP